MITNQRMHIERQFTAWHEAKPYPKAPLPKELRQILGSLIKQLTAREISKLTGLALSTVEYHIVEGSKPKLPPDKTANKASIPSAPLSTSEAPRIAVTRMSVAAPMSSAKPLAEFFAVRIYSADFVADVFAASCQKLLAGG